MVAQMVDSQIVKYGEKINTRLICASIPKYEKSTQDAVNKINLSKSKKRCYFALQQEIKIHYFSI